ncbi:MAG: hypothetical protein ACLP9L_06630 [Thermoguttaceae bacterium]
MRIRTPGFQLLLASCLLVTVNGSLPKVVHAETRTATGLTPEAVWEAIDAAKDGDTVQLPAGRAVWTCGWNTGHWAKMKAITIRGAGMDKTVIRDNRRHQEGGTVPFHLVGVEGKPFRVTGLTLDGTGCRNAGVWDGMMTITGNCKDFRIDHCKFKNADMMMQIFGDTYGLIDHCYFDALEYKGRLVQTIRYGGPGAASFKKPLSLGTDQALYFEDNEAHFSPEVVNPTGNNPWIVPYHGARIVIRHYKIINSQLEIYRPGMSDGLYGSQSAEVYDNEFSAVGLNKGRPQCVISIGAGVNIVFNNTVTGTTYNGHDVALRNERASRSFPVFGKSDGTNPLDGNQIPAGQPGAGYPCMGQPGRATDADGDGIYESTPCYAWNNTYNGEKLRMVVDSRADANERAQIKEGRDFFNEEPKSEYYKPYTYPHPLQGKP